MAKNEAVSLSAEYANVVKQAWRDPAFKARLLTEPVAVLAAAGIALPPDAEIKMHENTDKVVHFVLPAPPSDELSLEDLESAAGGYTVTKSPTPAPPTPPAPTPG
jgi:hypothetical protein